MLIVQSLVAATVGEVTLTAIAAAEGGDAMLLRLNPRKYGDEKVKPNDQSHPF